MTEATLTRDEEIKQIHREYTTFYQLGGGLLLVVIGVLIGALIFADDSGYGTNIYTEILSVGLTIGVLNVLQERRDTRNRIKDLQEQLVREAGSPAHALAISAVDAMRKRGWLGREDVGDIPNDDTKSLLENADLSSADLHGADLREVNLTGANLQNANLMSGRLIGAKLTSADLAKANLSSAVLFRANLISANLIAANLSNVELGDVNLTNANLRYTNLTNSNFHYTNLTNVDLGEANLKSANLRKANLSGTLINKTQFDENTILPDGSYWSERRDLAEFGAETRNVVSMAWKAGVFSYTFADGTKRRWQLGNGWLDDRDGNPIEEK